MLKAYRRIGGAAALLACAVVLLRLGLSMMFSQHHTVEAERSPQLSLLLPIAQPSAPDIMSREPIAPFEAVSGLDPKKVALGNRLFHETQLSSNNQISCASCHKHDLGGADGRPRSVGFEGQLAAFNAPTVWNSSLNFRQF